MNRDTLRQLLLDGIDRMLSHAWLLGLSAEQQQVLHAQRTLYQTNDQVLDELLRLLTSH